MPEMLPLFSRLRKPEALMFKIGDIVKIVGLPRNLSAAYLTSRGRPNPIGLVGEIVHQDRLGYDVNYTADAWWFDEDALCVPTDEEILLYKLGCV